MAMPELWQYLPEPEPQERLEPETLLRRVVQLRELVESMEAQLRAEIQGRGAEAFAAHREGRRTAAPPEGECSSV